MILRFPLLQPNTSTHLLVQKCESLSFCFFPLEDISFEHACPCMFQHFRWEIFFPPEIQFFHETHTTSVAESSERKEEIDIFFSRQPLSTDSFLKERERRATALSAVFLLLSLSPSRIPFFLGFVGGIHSEKCKCHFLRQTPRFFAPKIDSHSVRGVTFPRLEKNEKENENFEEKKRRNCNQWRRNK